MKTYAELWQNRRGEKLFSLLPWKQAGSVFELTGESLAQAEIRFLMADLDNTLCRYGEKEPSEELKGWLEDLRANQVELFLLSNSRKPGRAQNFAKALGIGYIGHAGKPKCGGFQKAMKSNNVTPEQCAMVGDQIFTDILGANRAGVRSILVKPIELAGNPGRYLRYGVEMPMRWLTWRRRWKGARA